jgi:hypothetical protein
MSGRQTPPLLLGAALVFWGWQSGFIGVGAILGLLIELPRWSRLRWEFSIEEFSRIWTFCSLLLLAGVVYAFTLNEGPSRFAEMFEDPDLRSQSRAGLSGARTAASLIRWLPMIFFLFIAAQQYSARQGVPMETVSLILRRRWKKAKKEGKPLPPSRIVDISYIYLVLCLFAASIHGEEGLGFFWGASALLAWGLWPFRSRRFRLPAWAGGMVAAVSLAWVSQYALGHFQQYLEGLNPQWLSSLRRGQSEMAQTKTSLGQIGRIQLSQKIVIRLEAKDGPAPTYLREASFDSYRSATWYSSVRGRDLERVQEESPNSGAFNLVPGKTNLARVEIASFLPGGQGLLPLPQGAGRLTNLVVIEVRKNWQGAVHASGPGLVVFDALFGPGAGIEGPPSDPGDYSVSEREQRALEIVVESLGLRHMSTENALLTIQNLFSQFEYSTWQERPPGYEAQMTPVARFLLQTHKGHCEYFATATVLLLHHLNIPARYTVGYVVHESPSGDKRYVVRQRDAHAWATVWDEKSRAWRDFDTTPASWFAAVDKPGWRRKIADAWSRLVFEFLRVRWGQTRLREYVLWVVLPILAVLLGQILFTRRRRARAVRRKARDHRVWPGADSELYEIERRLVQKGFARQPGEPITEWLLRGATTIPGLQDRSDAVQELLKLHYKYRFDPEGLARGERERLRTQARRLDSEVAPR